ncbi:Head fiber protein [Listeria monocytogenes]|uniref:Head fiber protein n=1 Tax=Listeria monocytogenes TaxID=1639 RepID=UPI000E760E31|nr:Head fiber protein [Listeria monocytogenes]EMD0560962.1 Head fiber protein [Listeria innocua]EAC8054789.1 Head fiber protein [Listeria monocytogenes]EAC8055622.1 Head fiber protein [Listeria monocytogenes]EAC8867756.1 Head fiber protein [Listeria monocytogenes]EAC8882792.1 Head fiber protein [Listeria monocytogenes]
MGYNTKNYTEQSGEKTVIGGELVIEEGAKVTGLPSSSNEKMVNQSDSTAETVEDLVADFNALLSKLKTSGYMSDN